jgi:CheY-like chemotaxis protein
LTVCVKKTYDVVLMDMQMPEMDGLGACMDAGMDYFLSRPVKIDVLHAALVALVLGHIVHAP